MAYMSVPFALLAALIIAYLVYRRHKTGRVTLRVRRILFHRVNLDLLFSALLVCALCAFFIKSDLKKLNELLALETAAASSLFVYKGRIVFYITLMAVFLARQLERPALREKGISSSRWFWNWDRINSYRWNGLMLEFQVGDSKKKAVETWAVAREQKQELNRLLKQKIKKQGKKTK